MLSGVLTDSSLPIETFSLWLREQSVNVCSGLRDQWAKKIITISHPTVTIRLKCATHHKFDANTLERLVQVGTIVKVVQTHESWLTSIRPRLYSIAA